MTDGDGETFRSKVSTALPPGTESESIQAAGCWRFAPADGCGESSLDWPTILVGTGCSGLLPATVDEDGVRPRSRLVVTASDRPPTPFS
jgi:hypothetical protein